MVYAGGVVKNNFLTILVIAKNVGKKVIFISKKWR